jgi:hypothetical protein
MGGCPRPGPAPAKRADPVNRPEASPARTTAPKPGQHPRGVPALDVAALLAALQDQLDDLHSVVTAQQRTLEQLLAAPTPTDPRRQSAGGDR